MSDNEWSEREVSESEDEISKVKFPKKPDVLLPRESQSLDERRKQLEGYLQQLVKSEELRNHKDLVSFNYVNSLRGHYNNMWHFFGLFPLFVIWWQWDGPAAVT